MRFFQDVKAGDRPDAAVLKWLVPGERVAALERSIRWLALEGRNEEAYSFIEVLRTSKPRLASELASRLVPDAGDAGIGVHELAIEGVRDAPRDAELRVQVAEQLYAAGRVLDALDLAQESPVQDAQLEMLKARALEDLGRSAEALVAARSAAAMADQRRRAAPREQSYWTDLRQQARLRAARLQEASSGLEEFANLARTGELAADSWQNLFILARSLREDQGYGPNADTVVLLDPAAVVSEYPSLSGNERYAVGALVRLGVAEMRLGRIQRAEGPIERAQKDDPQDYRVVMARAALLRLSKGRLLARASKLPNLHGHPRLFDRWPDWHDLTELERIALHAATERLAPYLPETSSLPRVLPLGRNPESLQSAVLCHELDLLDTEVWPCALSVADAAYPQLAEQHGSALLQVFERLRADVHHAGVTELDDLQQFFATAYRDWLVHTHFGLDTGALHPEITGFFDAVSAPAG